MPVKGYRSITVKEELYRELEKFMKEFNLTSLNDVIAFLLSSRPQQAVQAPTYELEYLRDRIDELSGRIAELESRISAVESQLQELQAIKGQQAVEDSKKRVNLLAKKSSISDIVRERKVELVSELNLKNPGKFIERARDEGIVVLEGFSYDGSQDTALIDPEFWEEFKEKIQQLNSQDEGKIAEALGAEGFKLFRFLQRSGMLYYGTDGKWHLST